MFLLRHLAHQGALETNNSVILKKFTKFRNYVRNTFSRDFHCMILTQSTPSYSFQKSVSYNYSNKVKEVTEDVDGALNKIADESAYSTEAIFAEIANGDDKILRKLKLLHFEIEVFKQTQKAVPDVIKKREWEHLLTLNSLNGRKKYLSFLFKNEKKTENAKKKKKLRREEFLKLKEEGLGLDLMDYNLNGQALLLRVYNKTLAYNLPFRNEVSNEIAQQIIFDCSYQEYMSELNSRFCAVQLLYCLQVHMFHRYPNLISLYNLKKTDLLHKILPSYMPQVNSNSFPWQMHEESYLDFYSKDDLVYLTPHCNEPLSELNPNDIYIIGAFVDKGIGVKASLARAKKNKLRMARFPLDEFVKWKQGTKSLPLNIVLRILLDMKFYKNWHVALKNLPARHQENEFNLDVKNLDDIMV